MLEAKGSPSSTGPCQRFRTSRFGSNPAGTRLSGPKRIRQEHHGQNVHGLLQPTRGEVTQDGEDIHKNLAAYRKRLGYVPEEANLYPYLTGEEYLEMVGTLRSMPEPRRKTAHRRLCNFSRWGPIVRCPSVRIPKVCANGSS